MAGVEANTVSTPTPLGGKFQPADARTIGDGDIIQATRQNTNPSGLTQFEITLPSGRRIESEWLREDQLKKALLPWIETIKAEMQADADEVRAQARRAAVERKASSSMAPTLVSPSGDALTAEPAVSAVGTTSIPAPRTSSTPAVATPRSGAGNLDPREFLRQAVDNARREARETEALAQEAMSRWQQASANLKEWATLLEAMSPKESNETSRNDSGSSSGIGSDIRTRAVIKRGRPAGSKNRPKPGTDVLPSSEGESGSSAA